QFRTFPIRRAELPECSADGHDTGGRHVDRAEAAMGGVVRSAELLRPETGQGLRLVAPREEGELLRILLANPAQPLRGKGESLLPRNLPEFARAARAGSQQRCVEPRRGIVLHDAGRALGAEHAAIDRMVAVALDIANLAVLQMHVDAAS